MRVLSRRMVSWYLALAALVALAAVPFAQEAKVDVTGKWEFEVQTSAGGGKPTLTFKQDGEKLVGHYSGQLGEADLTGTVKGTTINFTFTVEIQGQRLENIYSGTIEGSSAMKGKVVLAGLGDGTFTAKR